MRRIYLGSVVDYDIELFLFGCIRQLNILIPHSYASRENKL